MTAAAAAAGSAPSSGRLAPYGLQDATVVLGETTALSQVSVAVVPGRVVALVGGDGAGKTTLLRSLVGEVALHSGSISVPSSERIGYLPATVGSWLALSVQENLDFVGGVYGLSGTQLRDRADELMDRAGLADAHGRLSSQLSGGMRRKLGFCMAMIHRPELVILDEPSTGVDPVSRVDLWRLISQAAADGAAVLMSTTYLDEAERAETIVVLDRGQAILEGPPDDVVSGFAGRFTQTPKPVRAEWAWRRGATFHEFWPAGSTAIGEAIAADLEDVVIAASLLNRSENGGLR